MKVILVDIIPLGEDFPGGEKKGMSFWIMFIQCREKKWHFNFVFPNNCLLVDWIL